MNLTISGHQLDITEALRAYAENKMQHLLESFERVIDVHMILGTEKLDQYAEATVHVRGKKVFAKAQGQDAYAAIDGLIDKLKGQLVRHKERLSEHRATANG